MPHSTGEIDDRAPVLFSVPPGVLMRMREVVCFSSAATSFGFNVAGKCTRLGFTGEPVSAAYFMWYTSSSKQAVVSYIFYNIMFTFPLLFNMLCNV